MNQFINKLDQNYEFDVVVYERQLLISKFGFSQMILKNFIYDFWIENVILLNITLGYEQLQGLHKFFKR